MTNNNKELEFIESTGTQWIDTLYKPNSNTKIECKFSITQATPGSGLRRWPKVYGVYTDNNDVYQLQADTQTKLLNTSFYHNDDGYRVFAIDQFEYGTIYTTIQDKNEFIINNVSQGNSTNVTFMSNYNFYIFNLNYSGGVYCQPIYMKMYNMKIYDTNTIVRDFIPVHNTITNSAGLYDKVEGKFYPNNGTGVFTEGDRIN